MGDIATVRLGDWLEQLAAKQPTPGGGGAAALAASISAGLVGMVSNYTTGDKWATVSGRMQAIAAEAAELRVQALDLIAADAAAFQAVGTAYSMPKTSESEQTERRAAIQAALRAAAQPPAEVIMLTSKLIQLATELTPAGNQSVISDVAVAASQARAALEGAIINVEMNAKLIDDETTRRSLAATIQTANTAISQAQQVSIDARQRMIA